METKACTKCKVEKPLTAEYYHRDKTTSTGFVSHCKFCKQKYRQKNKEHFKTYAADYRSRPENKEVRRKYRYEYYQKNKERVAKRGAKYYQNNKEKKKIYEQQNKEKIAKRQKALREQRKKEQAGCIYRILNKNNRRIYIGQTTRGKIRWKEHLRYLRGNRHPNHKLQADFDKFGKEVFEWSIIKEVEKDKETLLLEEVKTIDSFLKQGKELYNLSLTIDQLQMLQEDK